MSLLFWRTNRTAEALRRSLSDVKAREARLAAELDATRAAFHTTRKRLDVMVNATIVEHPHCHWCGTPFNRQQVHDGTLWCCKSHKTNGWKRRNRLNGIPVERCPHPEKLAIPHRGTAVRWAVVQGHYFYECKCGVFHLTSAANSVAADAIALFRGDTANIPDPLKETAA